MHDLIEQLKQKRKELADREGIELFRVAQNVTLEATAAAMPKTKAELLDIKGWGPKNVEKYGDQILAILAGTQEEIEPVAEPPSGVLTVSQFLKKTNAALYPLAGCKIQGEISDVGVRANMAFFDLKDASGKEEVVKCFVGSWDFEKVKHLIESGLEVVIQGTPRIYEKYGSFSITVRGIEPVGEGALKKAFEALKKKLESQGYFDTARKRPIPDYIKKIGLITSETGEAVNDFKKNIGTHGLTVYLQDARVEGEYAEQQIVRAIGAINRDYPDLDVLVLMRGGGGLENLKTFNSEKIAKALLASRIPTITGIGHERDESIADYVADYTCSTPTGVATFIRAKQENLILRVEKIAETMNHAVAQVHEKATQILMAQKDQLTNLLERRLEQEKMHITNLMAKIENGLAKIFETFRRTQHILETVGTKYQQMIQTRLHQTSLAIQKITQSTERALESHKHHYKNIITTLTNLNPITVLERGYSVTYTSAGKILRSAEEVAIGEDVKIRLRKGSITGTVKKREA